MGRSFHLKLRLFRSLCRLCVFVILLASGSVLHCNLVNEISKELRSVPVMYLTPGQSCLTSGFIIGVYSEEQCVKYRNPSCNLYYEYAIKGFHSPEFSNVTLGLVGDQTRSFLCTIYFPPCGPSLRKLRLERTPGRISPCRRFCFKVDNVELKALVKYQGTCNGLPDRRCIDRTDAGQWLFITDNHSVKLNPTEKTRIPVVDDNDDNVEEILEQMSKPRTKLHRRYDILEKGSPDFFRGWADVQGLGMANDYCRVIGRGKRKFLSCSLAGSSDHNHHYVSSQGFEPGIRNSWFMRDMDNDGRDDYCRCVGDKRKSIISCMKADKLGFHGSPFVGGSQFTFNLLGSDDCYGQEINPVLGI